MSLVCSESEDLCWAEDVAYAVTHPLGPGYAVSGRVISTIPESERRPSPCGEMEGGLNIREGIGTKRLGTWQLTGFKYGKFLFSISEVTATRYLPRTLARISADLAEGAS